MMLNTPDTPTQAVVVFVIENTSANAPYIAEMKTNYIIPTLEYFHGSALEEGGSGSVYGIVGYKSADNLMALPSATYGPFTCPQAVLKAIDKLQFIGGHAEYHACLIEALEAAAFCFDEINRTDIPQHLLLVPCNLPYSAYGGGIMPVGAPCTLEQAARLLVDRGVQLSVASPRRLSVFSGLYELAGGDLHQAQQRNYAKDPRHLVLLRGFSLKERPPSPAPPPMPDIQGEVYPSPHSVMSCSQARAAGGGVRPPAPLFARQPGPPARAAWPPRQPLYASQSALLTQLAQPSYPPPPPQRMPGLVPSAGPSSSPTPQRSFIWSGVIEWMEKGKSPGDQQKTTRHLPCQVSAGSKEVEPELKVDTWPNKLLMQLMPKLLISNIGGQYLKDSKSVLFHLQPSEALDALTKVMVNGYAGCVHFSLVSSPPQCDIKVLILLYTSDKKAYLGFIPNNQATFVERLRRVIQQQKITQIIKQQPVPGGTGSGMPGAMASSSMSVSGALPPAGMSQGNMGANSMPGSSMAGAMPGANMQGAGMPGAGMQANMQGAAMQGAGMQANMQGGMQGGGMQSNSMPGTSMQGGNMPTGMQPVGPMQSAGGQGLPHPQSMMVGGGMGGQSMMMGGGMGGQVGGKGPRAVAQLDGLEAARQQNLEKIQHLQQTLEAATQQQYKSQMDIMNHLHAAQQQEQHYKQLDEFKAQMDTMSHLHAVPPQEQHYKQMEEQRKHQMQLQQQLRGAGAGHPPRIMRPLLPSNPGLRHLLQQQPQYRPGAATARPTTQAQPFDDVNNYDFL